jgi:excisionase family DNA binding protein
MLIVSPATATALAPHADGSSWVMFIQIIPPSGPGAIKVEAVKGAMIAARLRALAADNPFEVMLIGLAPTPHPAELAAQFTAQFAETHLHDGWFDVTPPLLGLVQAVGQHALQELLSRTHPAGLAEHPVDIEEMARVLGVSVPTVRRMVRANEVPYLRWGRMLRFVPADVIASLRRGR